MPDFEERGLPKQKRSILVVEDNELNRSMLCSLMEESYEVLEAADGWEGIDTMRRLSDGLSLVILDLFMPKMDGFEFLHARQNDQALSSVPVIVATSSDAVEDEIECLRLGANDFVRKPYNVDVILNRVGNIIRMRESSYMVSQLRWDALTGLYNEEFFYRRSDKVLEAYPGRSFDMVCTDVRNFKTLNERYGREHCDELLHSLAREFERLIPGVATSGRIGGDSFGFLIEHQGYDWTSDLDAAVRSSEVAHLYVRVGIVPEVDHGLAASELCNRAIIALHELRDSVGVGVAWYDDALRRRRANERLLAETMERGIENREFLVYYQPKHDLPTGMLSGAEALVRWMHPELGFTRPDVFVPLFERNGLIWQLDRYVCEEVCRELARFEAMGLPVVPISINVSPLDFDDHDLPEHVIEMTDRYGIDHSLLHIELTETAYAEDPDNVVHALERLRASGFKIELDDFGSGYSSLSLLNTLPLDIIKIDSGIVRTAARRGDFRIIQSAVHIAQLLGLETVIEGVESEDVLWRLRDLGCDAIQGFYYSWPLRREDFEEYVVSAQS